MIAFIRGKIISKGENFVVIENNGLGYKVFTVPEIAELPALTEVSLHTYFHVREDAQQLFGFKTASELDFFEMLITVSGVGPKMALAVLSSGDLESVKNAIASQDAAIFTKISGVGRKTAEKIIVELKDKLGMSSSAGIAGADSGDFISALENLGYSAREIRNILPKIDPGASAEERLRQALKLLSKK